MFDLRSKKVVWIVVVLAAVLAVSVYARFSLLSPSEGPQVIITSPPLEFSMGLDKTEYAYGENITITFCLRNTSNQTIEVGWPYMNPISYDATIVTDYSGVSDLGGHNYLLSGLSHFDFSITDINGTEVFRWDGGGLAMVFTCTFEAGGYLRQTHTWNYYGIQPLARGTYQIRGILVADSTPGSGGTLETPSIAFAIQ